MPMNEQNTISNLLDLSSVHAEWRKPLTMALTSVDPDYLQELLDDDAWLPGPGKLFAAFCRDRMHCRYILFGESPYPRPESANGIAFYDAAVSDVWSENGLGKAVNRATSLRNLIKSMLLAEGLLEPRADGSIPQQDIAALDKTGLIRTIAELFSNLERAGFLMFNATPVFHPRRKPRLEARYWHGFIDRLLAEIASSESPPPTLILWGRIAAEIESMPASASFPRLVSEHPYNISFITNPGMQALFRRLRLLHQ